MYENLVFPGEYKETAIGLLPAEWEIKRLGEVCRLERGSVEPTEIPDTPYVSLGHIDSGDPQLRQWGSSTEVKSSKKTFLPGDVLYGKLRPYLDKAVLAEIEGVCSTDILVLKARSRQTTPGFLVNLLHTRRFLEYAISTTSGTNLPRTRWSSLRDYRVALPPLTEQRRIASALRTIQEAIAAQEDVITSGRELKRSLMDRLFTHGPGPEPASTRETEIGEIPEHWKIVKLEEVADLEYGAQAAVAHLTDEALGIPILTNVNITLEGELDLSTLRFYELPDKWQHKRLQKGDVLFNWRSGSQDHVGKTAIFDRDEPFTFSSFILRFRPTGQKLRSAYLAGYLHHLKARGFFKQMRQRSSVNLVFNKSESARIPVSLPPLSEQEEIVSALSAADARIGAAKQRKAALEELYRSALEQFMTGRIRLTQEDSSEGDDD